MERSRAKDVAIAVALLLFGVLMLEDKRVPLLSLVDFGIHEFGHLLTYVFPPLITAAAGSFAQCAFPFGLAVYFFFFQKDDSAAALCLGWTATNALDVAKYMADAPYQLLPLWGNGMHDWAFVFGELHLLNASHTIATMVRVVGWIELVVAFAILAWPYTERLRVSAPRSKLVP